MIQLTRLDHFVLTVSSVEAAAAFYEKVLGFDVERYANGRIALRSGNLRINLHDEDHAPDRRAASPGIGAGDFCYQVAGPIDAVIKHLDECAVTIEEGPVTRNGSKGEMTSIYFRDPDRNLVEVSVYD